MQNEIITNKYIDWLKLSITEILTEEFIDENSDKLN
jgi:hypothetical protein